MLKNHLGPFLGLALVSISATTATAQQKATEPATVTGDKAPVYDVVSIRPSKIGSGSMISWYYLPDGLSAKNVTLQVLIQSAYGVEDYCGN